VEHFIHLRALLERLQHYGLVINGSNKCVFSQTSAGFLSHKVFIKGTLLLNSYVAVILDFVWLLTVKHL
jgi:hypothetical protein